MKSFVAKRSVVIGGHKTSVSLEDQFWHGLKQIALEQQVTMSELIANIDGAREDTNLSSALRVLCFATSEICPFLTMKRLLNLP